MLRAIEAAESGSAREVRVGAGALVLRDNSFRVFTHRVANIELVEGGARRLGVFTSSIVVKSRSCKSRA